MKLISKHNKYQYLQGGLDSDEDEMMEGDDDDDEEDSNVDITNEGERIIPWLLASHFRHSGWKRQNPTLCMVVLLLLFLSEACTLAQIHDESDLAPKH